MKKLFVLISVLFLVLNGCATHTVDFRPHLTDHDVRKLAILAAEIEAAKVSGCIDSKKIEEVLDYTHQLSRYVQRPNKGGPFERIAQDRWNELKAMSNENFAAFCNNFKTELPDTIRQLTLKTQQAIQERSRNIDNHNQRLQSINQAAESLSKTARSMKSTTNQSTYSAPTVAPLSVNPNQTRRYMINTDEGINHKRCITLADGSSYCY